MFRPIRPIETPEEHRVELAVDDGAQLRHVDDDLPFRPRGLAPCPCRRCETLLPIEYPVIVCPIIVLIVLRLRRIVASQLGKHRQSRFSYASTAIAARANANAGIIRIGHDEPFRPSMELRAQLRGRRRYVRYRTHQPTPVSAGATLVHHACARLQRGDVLTTGRKNPLALRTHRAVERILRRLSKHVRHEIAVGHQQLRASQQRSTRIFATPSTFATDRLANLPAGPFASPPISLPASIVHRRIHLQRRQTQRLQGLIAQLARPWQELVAFRRLERRIPSVADHRIFKIAGMLAHKKSIRQRRIDRMQTGHAVFGGIDILNFRNIGQVARLSRSGNDIEHGIAHLH